jgi:hypothetical protein
MDLKSNFLDTYLTLNGKENSFTIPSSLRVRKKNRESLTVLSAGFGIKG